MRRQYQTIFYYKLLTGYLEVVWTGKGEHIPTGIFLVFSPEKLDLISHVHLIGIFHNNFLVPNYIIVPAGRYSWRGHVHLWQQAARLRL